MSRTRAVSIGSGVRSDDELDQDARAKGGARGAPLISSDSNNVRLRHVPCCPLGSSGLLGEHSVGTASFRSLRNPGTWKRGTQRPPSDL